MISNADKGDTDSLKALWRACFGDSEAYTDYYFSRRYRPERTLVIRDNGAVIASSQETFHQMPFFGETKLAAYILGVCTHPEYRGRGLMSQLMRRALREQARAGAFMSTLIPQEGYLFDVYRRCGFFELFYAEKTAIGPGGETGVALNVITFADADKLGDAELAKLYDFYDRMYKKFSCTLLKSFADFSFFLKSFIIFDGAVYVCLESGGDIGGVCFLETHDGKLLIKELLCGDDAARAAILSKLFSDTGEREIGAVLPGGRGSAPLGMGRILNVPELLNAFSRFAESDILIRVYDDIINHNNGTFLLSKNGARITDAAPDFETDIGGLFRLLARECEDFNECGGSGAYDGFRPYINLMLN